MTEAAHCTPAIRLSKVWGHTTLMLIAIVSLFVCTTWKAKPPIHLLPELIGRFVH